MRIDRTRTPEARTRRISRRSQRRAKSAMAFLCIAFPGQL